MKTVRRFSWLLLLLLLSGVVVACGSQVTPVAEPDSEFVLALPRLVIDVDSDGVPSVAGLDPQTLKTITFGQVDLTGVRVPKPYVDWFTATNLQHIEVVHRDDGEYIFVNGNPLPHVGWDADSLRALSDLAGELGVVNRPMAKVLSLLVPFVQRLGLNVAVRFPVQDGVDIIPLRDPGDPIPQVSAESEAPSIALMKVHMNFDENGIPSVLSVSTRELEEALGVSLRQMELPPSAVQQMIDAGIQHITVRTMPSGLYIWVNDNPLPTLVWSDEYLENAANLYGQLYYTDAYATARDAVKTLLPLVDNVDGEIVLIFPVPEGATKIPIPSP
ncbi:MAG: hypothetical protein GXP42_01730 [Chloroflexi bacterium]|nr:hypothetical protein [Chloroflexota bacterium]